MLDIILIVISALCMIAGLAGCILPFLPGPPIAYVGLVILHFTDKVQYSTTQLIVWLLIVAVLQVLDYFTPMLGSKYSGGSKWGNWGCIIGTLVGLFFLPWGIILGPFLGAVIGELLGNKEFSQALKSGVGSLLGFIFGTLLKFVVCGYFCAILSSGISITVPISLNNRRMNLSCSSFVLRAATSVILSSSLIAVFGIRRNIAISGAMT